MDSQENEIKMSVGMITGIELKASRYPPGLWRAVVREQRRLSRLLDMNQSPYRTVYRTFPGNWNFPTEEQSSGRLNRGMSPFVPLPDYEPFFELERFEETIQHNLIQSMGINPDILKEHCVHQSKIKVGDDNRMYSIARRPGKATMQHRSDPRTITASLLYSGLDPDKILIIDPKFAPIPNWEKELENFPRTWEGTFTVENKEDLKKFMEDLAPKHIPHYAPKPEVNLSPRAKRKSLIQATRKRLKKARRNGRK